MYQHTHHNFSAFQRFSEPFPKTALIAVRVSAPSSQHLQTACADSLPNCPQIHRPSLPSRRPRRLQPITSHTTTSSSFTRPDPTLLRTKVYCTPQHTYRTLTLSLCSLHLPCRLPLPPPRPSPTFPRSYWPALPSCHALIISECPPRYIYTCKRVVSRPVASVHCCCAANACSAHICL